MRKFQYILLPLVSTVLVSQSQPQVGTYPPQIHQQICQNSTYTRYLNVFNTGNANLTYTASWSPAPVGWVTASPMGGQIPPGDTLVVQFDFNSTGLPLDNYLVDYVISSNDPNYPEWPVLAMLHVQDLNILINPDADTVCSGCSTKLNTIVFGCSEAYSFLWVSNPPGFTSTEKSPVVSPEVTTTYTVTVTDGGYSKDGSVKIVVPGTTGIEEPTNHSIIRIWPNPAKDHLLVSFHSDGIASGCIAISDISGRQVFKKDIEINNGHNEYSLGNLNMEPGLYLVRIIDNDKTPGIRGVSKLLIEK